ncbi:MAG: hypothetical protein NT013_14050 [Planctomycetia bacterium]|nr:hypothetical protein [Planctomycetia bacterium]
MELAHYDGSLTEGNTRGTGGLNVAVITQRDELSAHQRNAKRPARHAER